MRKQKIEILYEDEALLVVYKPADLLSIPDRFQPEKFNLLHFLRDKYESVFVVHRLDRETSGVMCFARNEDAHKALSRQFEERTVKKLYLAVVEGQFAEGSGLINHPIGPHPSQSGKMIITTNGKASQTAYDVKETFRHFSLVEANILTGRTHQIRVHFAHIGHPLAVDPLYGRRKAFFLSEIKTRRYRLGKDQEERPLIDRTSLHALKLGLSHPLTEKQMNFEAPIPKDMKALIHQLRKIDRQ